MKALRFHGKELVSVDDVEKPKLIYPTDIIVKVTTAAICGSDLHLYGNLIPALEDGDILGHEFMGTVEEVGEAITHVRIGDKVVIPFTIACGTCYFCKKEKWSLCDTSNKGNELAETMFGYPTSAIFGYSHMFGGVPGGQAEYVRVPYANVGAFKVPHDIPDEKLLFLGDIFPTGWAAAKNCKIEEGDTVAIWGAGPVGQFALRSALMLGAKRVIVIDRFNERLEMAKAGGAEVINYEEVEDVFEILKKMTEGMGPDACIDAVGMEAHGAHGMEGMMNVYDEFKQMLHLESDRPTALRQIIHACKKGGTISLAGVYSGIVDKFPLGVAFNKSITFVMGQTHVQKYIPLLLDKIISGEIDPSFVITHTLPLDDAPQAYQMFQEKKDGCIKVILKP